MKKAGYVEFKYRKGTMFTIGGGINGEFKFVVGDYV
jgi:hypothetical protein